MANKDKDFADGEQITGDETEVDMNEVERLLREDDDEKDNKKKIAADDVVVEEEGEQQTQEAGAKKKVAAEDGEEQEGHETARTEEERELIRQRRREEKKGRKMRQRERMDEKDRTISAQSRLLNEALARLDALENRTTSADMARLDEAIEQSKNQLEQARIAFLDSGDDKAKQLEAQEVLYQARSRLEHLEAIKQRVNQASTSRNNVRKPVDPAVARHGKAWMAENKWYDSTGKDPDSRILTTIDETLAQEGWDPRTPEYWEELTARGKRYLPHRFTRYNSRDKEADDRDEELDTDQQQQEETKRKAITAGSGRDNPGAGSKKTFKINADRVAAMKEAGIWDDPKARAKQIKAYMNYDKQQKNSANN